LANALLWGNGYAAIIRNPSSGQPIYLINLLSRNVTVYKHDGDLWYRDVSTGTTYHSSDIIHVKGVGLDGIMGLSPIRQMRNTMVTASGVDIFGAEFYEAGTIMAGYITHPNSMTKDQYQNYILYWEQNWAGGKNRGKTPLLDGGAEYKEVGMPLADAQFLESKKFNVDDIARIFQVPPHKIGNMDRSTFNNIEEQNIDFVETTLLNWATELEAEHNLKLIIPQAGKDIYNKLELKGLLRGDIESRTAFYTAMFDRGVFNGNDIAKLEEMNEYDGGDIRFVSQNLRGLKEPANERPTNSNPS
jgi:HK97 family phage portal protein